MNNFELYIEKYFEEHFDNNVITDAMKYCMDGGKRIRPRIIFEIAKDLGINEEECYPCALALEFIQTYSLIHDDLPAMDNDDFRRGKPSCHKAFGEDVAILTGDALLNHSFGIIADSDYKPEIKAKMISCLSKYAGMSGMILGQLLDVKGDKQKDAKYLFDIQDNKTGGLFKISCLFPMYLKGLDKEEYFRNIGSQIGVIFQNQDDLFDVIKTEEEAGKSLSDKDNDKFTALSLYSLDELKKIIDKEFKDLDEYLTKEGINFTHLKNLMLQMKNR